MPKKPAHSFTTQEARDGLAQVLPPGWLVNLQEPITTADSEPETDLAVVRGDRRRFRKRHPGPKDVGLVAEVADTTLQRDRGPKKRIRALIPVYWIINLAKKNVEVYTEPTGPAPKPDYRQRHDYHHGEEIPLRLHGKEIGRLAVADLFG